MEATELLEIVARGEDSKHQLKANVTNGLSLAQEIVAFSNSGGGTLFIGVNDDGTFSRLERKDIERLNNLVSNAASQQVSPPSIRKPKLFPHWTGWLCGLSYPMASVNLRHGQKRRYLGKKRRRQTQSNLTG